MVNLILIHGYMINFVLYFAHCKVQLAEKSLLPFLLFLYSGTQMETSILVTGSMVKGQGSARVRRPVERVLSTLEVGSWTRRMVMAYTRIKSGKR